MEYINKVKFIKYFVDSIINIDNKLFIDDEMDSNEKLEDISAILGSLNLNLINKYQPENAKDYSMKINIVKKLLLLGCEVDRRFTNESENAVHKAIKNKESEIVHFLLAFGINSNLKNKNGQTALDIANSDKFLEVIPILAGNNPKSASVKKINMILYNTSIVLQSLKDYKSVKKDNTLIEIPNEIIEKIFQYVDSTLSSEKLNKLKITVKSFFYNKNVTKAFNEYNENLEKFFRRTNKRSYSLFVKLNNEQKCTVSTVNKAENCFKLVTQYWLGLDGKKQRVQKF